MMPILDDLSFQIKHYLNNNTDFEDWEYAFYDAPQRHWSAIYREGWNVRSQGVFLVGATNQGVPLNTNNHRPVVWFELAHDRGNYTMNLNYYLCFDSSDHLLNYLLNFHDALSRISINLASNLNPRAINLSGVVNARLIDNNRIEVFHDRITNLSANNMNNIAIIIGSYIADNFLLIDDGM